MLALWIFLATYVPGFVVCARKIAFLMIQNCENTSVYGRVDGDDKTFSCFIGILSGLGWPLVLAATLLFFRLPKTDKQVQKELAEKASYIKQLEREAGMHEHK